MKRALPAAAAALALLAGCIVCDELTTITIQPDGSADWVRYQSNIHSTEKGEKGAEELKRFAEEFEARGDADFARLRQAGGEVVEARWVRQREPYATLVVGRLPGAKALEEFCTIRNDKGEAVVRGRFTRDGRRRRLTLSARVPKEDLPAASDRPTESQRRQEAASGLSETRVVTAGGEITSSRGFIVAEDRRSALLDHSGIQDLLIAAGGTVELYLEWEITGN